MRYIKLIFIFLTILSFSNDKEIKVIKYDGLNNEMKKNLDLFLLDSSFKFDNMKMNFKTKYSLGKKQNVGEIFLENLNKDNSKEFKIGIKDNLILNKSNIKNVVSLYALKSVENNGNVLDIGLSSSYDLLKNLDRYLYGFNTGISFIAKVPEYDIHLMLLNEYNFNLLKDKTYLANNLTGLIGLKYKKELGNLFYLEPNLSLLYKFDFGTKLKFNNTEVILKDKINYALAGGIKLGIELEKNDNLYNVFFDFDLSKIMKEYTFLFKFNDEDRISKAKLSKDFIFGINLGSDVLIKKNNKLSFFAGLDLGKDVLDYKIGLNYEFIK